MAAVVSRPPNPIIPIHDLAQSEHSPSSQSFDILRAYETAFKTHPTLPRSVAAILALIDLLAAHQTLRTVSETLDLLAQQIAVLHQRVPDPVLIQAGTDLVQQYLVTRTSSAGLPSSAGPNSSSQAQSQARQDATTQNAGTDGLSRDQVETTIEDDLETLRQRLIAHRNGIVARAESACTEMCNHAAKSINNGSTVVVNGCSASVATTLLKAAGRLEAERHGGKFSVVVITDHHSSSHSPTHQAELNEHLTRLRQHSSIRAVECQPPSFLESFFAAPATTPGRRNAVVLVTAEAVCASGATVAAHGNALLAQLAHAAHVPVYVLGERITFVRSYPLRPSDLGQARSRLTNGSQARPDETYESQAKASQTESDNQGKQSPSPSWDLLPAVQVTALVSEAGIGNVVAAVTDELSRLWW